jgi:DNA polymerase-3 subunit gamma/tau
MERLTEKLRPQTWGQVVGQPKAVSRARGLVAAGVGGRAVWITGPSGCGKTTIAKLLAAEIADPLCTEELKARTLTAGDLEQLERESHFYGVGVKTGRAYIVNEAHGLRKATIEAFHDLLERVPGHVVWIFTTTNDGAEKLFEDSLEEGPFLSRCYPIQLARQGLAKTFAEYLATVDPTGPRTAAEYLKLIQDCKNNLRLALQRLEADALAAYVETADAAECEPEAAAG